MLWGCGVRLENITKPRGFMGYLRAGTEFIGTCSTSYTSTKHRTLIVVFVCCVPVESSGFLVLMSERKHAKTSRFCRGRVRRSTSVHHHHHQQHQDHHDHHVVITVPSSSCRHHPVADAPPPPLHPTRPLRKFQIDVQIPTCEFLNKKLRGNPPGIDHPKPAKP